MGLVGPEEGGKGVGRAIDLRPLFFTLERIQWFGVPPPPLVLRG
jgi:hypothetical protein